MLRLTPAAGRLSRVALAALALALCSCERETRQPRVDPSSASTVDATNKSHGFVAGPTLPGGGVAQPTASAPEQVIPYKTQRRAYEMSEGQRLFSLFNCVGCHGHGGGDKGPPLMDGKWLYGSDLQDVYLSIVEGRPNGMPSFRGKIVDQQLWQLAAYVRSMSGLAPMDAAPGRMDDISARPPENSTDPQGPTQDPGASPPPTPQPSWTIGEPKEDAEQEGSL